MDKNVLKLSNTVGENFDIRLPQMARNALKFFTMINDSTDTVHTRIITTTNTIFFSQITLDLMNFTITQCFFFTLSHVNIYFFTISHLDFGPNHIHMRGQITNFTYFF